MPKLGKITKLICLSILVTSLGAALVERKFGVGTHDLIFQTDAMWKLELWRLVTYPFVETDPIGLVISLVVFWLLGSFFEERFGRRGFMRFCAWSAVGAALIAVPLSVLIDWVMPFYDQGSAAGPRPVLDAFLVALALYAPNAQVLMGFVLPVRAKTIVFILLGLEIVTGVMTGAANLSITLGGMAMGYFLSTGNWRWQRLRMMWRSFWLRRRHPAGRRGFYVVPPPPGGKQVLH